MSKKVTFGGSVKFALSGIKEAFKSEPNFRIHTAVAVLVLIAAFLLGFTTTEWVILFFTISFVLILELINTSLEEITDLASPDYSPKAKIAKDVSAAAVLVGAGVAIIVGAILFLPKFF